MSIYSDAVLADSPVVYLRLGEPSGTNANDETANNRDGTYQGAVTLGAAGALVADSNTAVTLSGSTTYISVPDQAALDLGDGPFTLECWVKTTSSGQSLISKGANGYDLRIAGGTGLLLFEKQELSSVVSSTVAVNDGAWHHCVYTKNGGASVLYVDGGDRTGTVTNATLADTAIELNFGRRAGIGDSGLTGTLDEVAVYNRVLSLAQVLYHYQAGTNTVPVQPLRLVREKPPLRQSIDAATPSGRHYRWGEDEPDPANVPGGLRHSSTMPGGFESCDVTLPRKPGVDYSDLERLTTIRVLGPSGSVVGEYRLERAPRTSGDEMSVSPSAVGWQAHLDDDKSAVMVPVDRDMSRWQGPTLARQANRAAASVPQGKVPVQIDAQGIVWNPPNEALPLNEETDVEYSCPSGVQIDSLGYVGKRDGTWTNFEAATLYTDDRDYTFANSATLTLDDAARTATPSGLGRYAMLRTQVTTGHTPAAGVQQRFSKLAVYGNHGITFYDTGVAGELNGVLASDVVRYAVGRWAPLLTVKSDSIQRSGFVIPHLVFLEPTTAGEIVRQASRFNLPDWGVWEGKEFVWVEQGARARRWRARIGPSQLEETGPQADRLWESIVVSYQDVDGSTRTVGPPGSYADTISTDLKDYDTENPANQLGIVRRDLLQMGVSTAAGATEVGRQFLERSRLLDSSGRATLVGWVEDDRGVLHPYFEVRAGDEIAFVDASDKSYRRIVRADHDRGSRSCSVDLDSPPEGLEQLLERLGVVLVPLGV